MSLTRLHSWLAAFVAVISLAASAGAQEFHNEINPFVELDEFGGHDFQFFAPAEVGDFGGIDPPNTGFYFTYDRLYINVDRPKGVPSFGDDHNGDFGWGNRIDAGYMTEEEVGWGISLTHLDGPNENLITFQERLQRFNEDDDPPGSGGEPILQDRNPRRYLLHDSINTMKFSSFELNRVWRRKQFHNGGVLEPFIGFRYMNFKDFGSRENYTRYAEDAVGDEVPFTDPRREGPYEDFISDRTVFENMMIGGQLGVRLHKQAGHWLLSSEFRAFAVENFQYFSHRTDRFLTRAELEDETELEIHEQTIVHDNFNEFVWGGEVRGEASYQLTRDISFRTGFMVTALGQGIARGVFHRTAVQDPFPFLAADRDQSVWMAGVTFGVTINR